jgi:hypothetical protein
VCYRCGQCHTLELFPEYLHGFYRLFTLNRRTRIISLYKRSTEEKESKKRKAYQKQYQ